VPHRLAQKLILSLTVIVVVIAAIAGLINVRNQERQLLNSVIVGADQLSRGIASSTWQAMMADHREAAYSVMQTIAMKQGIDRIRIYNRDGRIMFSTKPGEANLRVDRSSDACAVCHGKGKPRVELSARSRARVWLNSEGTRLLSMLTPIYNEPSCSEAACHAHPKPNKVLGVLDVDLHLNPVDEQVEGMKMQVFVVTGIQIVLISVFIILFTRRFVSSPIRKLIEGTQAISVTNLDRPIEIIHSSEELDELVRGFNSMRERLALAIAEINQFTEKLEATVTERTAQLKFAHQKLLQTDRLASLGQLAASVAHEINNPVAGVLNLSMLLQRILKEDGIPPGRIQEFRKYLTQITHETSRVGRIVSDLLAFSRRSKPQRSPADLNRIISITLSLCEHKLKMTNVAVETSLTPNLPQIPCDSSQIQQVLLNLVMNAAEATSPRGNGIVRVATALAPNGQAVLITVADNGEGIAPENLSKIFDPFFTTKPEGKGVGLGLAVLYGIVDAHGGEVDVKSAAGEGTTFTVSLPLAAVERPTEIPLPAGREAAPGRELSVS
jgi:two-component system NtrC family sensor kinase